MNNLVNCKACGKEIAKGVKKCPNCGKDQRNFFFRHKIISIIGIIIIIGIIGSITGNKNGSPKKVADSSTASEATSNSTDNAKSNAPETFKIGDTIETKNYKITVNSVRTATQDNTGFIKPQDGNEFFLVSCTIENISSQDQAISSVMMFKVVDETGLSYNQSIFPDAKGQLDGQVAPTRKITGEYCVEVPKGKTGLELQFDSSILLDSKQVIVKLN